MRQRALWRLRSYLLPYRRQVVLMLVGAMAGMGAATLIPLFTKSVIDGPVRRGERGAVIPLIGLILAFGLIEALMAFMRRYVLSAVANGMEMDLRNDLYAHLQRLPVSFHDQWQSGQLLSRAMSDISIIRRFFGFGLIFLITNAITFVVVVGFLLNLHAPLALLVVFMALPIFIVGRRFERDYRRLSRRLQDEGGDLTTLVEEAAGGIRVVKAFGRHRLMEERFAARAERVYGTSMESVRLRGTFWAVLGSVPNLTLALVLLGGAFAVGRGSLTIGGLIAFNSWLLSLVWPIESMGEILAMGEEAATAADRIYEVLDTEPEIADRPGAFNLPEATGALRFEGVGFAYPNADGGVGPDLIHHVDLDVRPGETLAIVGVTGSGKTTLVSLVPRLHDVTSGRITLDGHDIRDLSLDSLRRHVGVAFEDPTLFSASVRENLLLGYPDATEDDIATALDVAQAGFVHDLPWGLDTRVGEQGLSLSGGQRQRLALARAIIGRPRVLVLDDPLSALDVHTEALIEDALRRILTDVTALLVVHRPSTLALADRVALLHGGTIAAVGTHSELMATVPVYREILAQEAEEVSR